MSSDKAKTPLIALGLLAAVITALVYLPALSNGFVDWDDYAYIYENRGLAREGLDFVRWAFTSVVNSNWHPLTVLTYGVEYSLWGVDPFGYHLVNLLFHAANAFLVFWLAAMLLRTAIGGEGKGRGVLFGAFVAAMVFGIHPQHVESVAWVSERKDVLSGFFFLLSLIFYVRGAAGGGRRIFLWACFASFVLAILSKPMAITLPVVLLILDFYPLRRLEGVRDLASRLKEKALFFAVMPAAAALTVWAQHGDEAIASFEASPFSQRVDVAIRGLVFYLEKLVYPADLAPFYVRPFEGEFYNYAFFIALGVVAAITALAVVFRKRRAICAAWAYYVVTLLPVIGLVQVSDMAAADRYSYLPTLGPVLLVAGAAGLAVARNRKALFPAAIVFAALLAASGYLTVRQVGVWKDSVALWTQEIRVFPTVQAYMKRARAYERDKRYAEAAGDYTVVIDNTDEGLSGLYVRRGAALRKAGKTGPALSDFDEAVRQDPSSAAAFLNRGELLGSTGDLAGALRDLERALELSPGNPVALYYAGDAYERAGNREKGLYYLRQAADKGVREARERLEGAR